MVTCAICVVFPDPVSPMMMLTLCLFTMSRIACLNERTGSCSVIS